MKYPALADKIIDILKGDIWMTPAQVATTINEGSEKVRLTMREMASLKSFWFEIQTEPGNEDFKIIKRGKFENEIFLWKQFGGFSQYQADFEKEQMQKLANKELDRRNLELASASIEQAIKNSNEARARANWSLFVAGLALIISLLVWISVTLNK